MHFHEFTTVDRVMNHKHRAIVSFLSRSTPALARLVVIAEIVNRQDVYVWTQLHGTSSMLISSKYCILVPPTLAYAVE